MKTKELIRQLQKEDPSGELEVSCGLIDIFFVERQPCYYDGYQQVLIRDPSKKPYYDVVGGKYNGKNDKVVIKTLSFTDAQWDDDGSEPFPIDYSELPGNRKTSYSECHDHDHDSLQKAKQKNEFGRWLEWLKPKLEKYPRIDTDSLEQIAFFLFRNLGIRYTDPLPPEITNGSYVQRRHQQWENEFDISWDSEIILKRKNEK